MIDWSKPSVGHYLNDWHRTPAWQQLSWVGGDEWAELLCEAADASEDPPAVIRQLVAISRLGGRDGATALYLQIVDEVRRVRKHYGATVVILPLLGKIEPALFAYLIDVASRCSPR